ncbi:EMC6-like membrane protein [Haladaptatus sp. NG-WS-4]
MATEQASERRAAHLRSITVTSLASLAGIAAAFVSAAMVGTKTAAATDQLGLAIVLGFVVVQLPLLRVIGYELDGVKDYLYVTFMTFSLWFITWGILLMNHVQV